MSEPTEAEKLAASVIEQLLNHSQEFRDDFFEAINRTFCSNCHEITNGSQCYCCYDSRRYD